NSPPKKLLIFLTVLFIICSISIGLFVHKKLEYRIQYLSILKIAEYLTKNLNNDEVVFAFDRSDLYDKVQNAKINFYLNDSTVRYFDIVTAKELYNALKIDKVKYIFTASYRPFIVNKSAFNELLANHAYTEIVVTEQNYTLYRLNYALLNKSDVKKLKTSILIKNQYTYVNLKQNTEYLVDVIQMSKDSDNFYTLLATANGYNYAYFTHNGSTKFRVKTPTLEGDNEAVLTLSITAKDKPLQLKIDIFEAN
ncbi:hypothetical protein, partial [Candidatus Tisiphia endosymbiont of Nemotelus uliginosus]|uniref:hypothetical protein n=1 Tax=Candidatus Tisiphia endosymbiont of Nemotelus uliginosus TaxID=3077926 RepID=UPI0035C8AD64